MAQKTPRMDDVKRPDRVTPSATSRPILVSNGSTVTTDPMMAPSDDTKKEVADSPLTHTKTIDPIDSSLKASDQETTAEPDTTAAETIPPTEEGQESNTPDAKEDSKPAVTGGLAGTSPVSVSTSDANHDEEGAVSAEEIAREEAKAKREQELESLITSEKYVVPIDAVQRKRSRSATIGLCVLAILLAIVLVDVILDVGIVKVPASIPHTHLFSK